MAKKILIVEDDPAFMKILKDTLIEEGYDIEAASDGVEGLEAALRVRPDLILLDVLMPRMDGITMLKKLREHGEGKNMQVIVLTNLSDTQKILEALEGGAYDYLVKTHWTLSELSQRIKEKLSS